MHLVLVQVLPVTEGDYRGGGPCVARWRGYLPQRSRYYQALIDSKLLEPGADYKLLNPVVIILITPFDLFGLGRYRYTFTMQCEEADVRLEDGAVRIFLNTHGSDDENITPELKELLYFMEHTNEGHSFESHRVRQLQKNVLTLQNNAELGVKFMQAWEEIALARQEAREEGLDAGLKRGLAEGREAGRVEGRAEGEEHKLLDLISKKLQKGQSVEQIAEALEESPAYIRELMAKLA